VKLGKETDGVMPVFVSLGRTRTHSDALGLSDCPTDTSTQSDDLPFRGESESVCVSVPESVCDEKPSESEWIEEGGIDESL
jgi:hypothetical protein